MASWWLQCLSLIFALLLCKFWVLIFHCLTSSCLKIREYRMKKKKIVLQRRQHQKVSVTTEVLHRDQALFFLLSQLAGSNFDPQAKIFMMSHQQRAMTHLPRRLEQAFPCRTRRRHTMLWLKTSWRNSCPRRISRCPLCQLKHLIEWTEKDGNLLMKRMNVYLDLQTPWMRLKKPQEG